MANFLGMIVGVYLFYALLAAIFKHKAGFIIACVLGIGTGITAMVRGEFRTLAAAIVVILLVAFIPKIQIRKNKS